MSAPVQTPHHYCSAYCRSSTSTICQGVCAHVHCLCVAAFFCSPVVRFSSPCQPSCALVLPFFFSLWSDYWFSPPSAKWFSSTYIFFKRWLRPTRTQTKMRLTNTKSVLLGSFFLCCSRWAKQCMSLSVYLCVFLCHFSNFFCL